MLLKGLLSHNVKLSPSHYDHTAEVELPLKFHFAFVINST